MAESVHGIDDLRFEHMDPSVLAKDRWDEIVELRHDYYGRALMGRRSPREITHFVEGTTRASWDNPNDSDLRGSYARARVGAAFDKRDNLVGFTYTADNSSSTRGEFTNLAERLAKLYIPRYIHGRYHWQRELVDNGEGRPGLREALAAISIRPKRPQPMSIWILREESDLLEEAQAWNFTANSEPEERVMFGDDSYPTHITMYKATSTYEVYDRLLEQPEGLAAVSFAMQSIQRATQKQS